MRNLVRAGLVAASVALGYFGLQGKPNSVDSDGVISGVATVSGDVNSSVVGALSKQRESNDVVGDLDAAIIQAKEGMGRLKDIINSRMHLVNDSDLEKRLAYIFDSFFDNEKYVSDPNAVRFLNSGQQDRKPVGTYRFNFLSASDSQYTAASYDFGTGQIFLSRNFSGRLLECLVLAHEIGHVGQHTSLVRPQQKSMFDDLRSKLANVPGFFPVDLEAQAWAMEIEILNLLSDGEFKKLILGGGDLEDLMKILVEKISETEVDRRLVQALFIVAKSYYPHGGYNKGNLNDFSLRLGRLMTRENGFSYGGHKTRPYKFASSTGKFEVMGE